MLRSSLRRLADEGAIALDRILSYQGQWKNKIKIMKKIFFKKVLPVIMASFVIMPMVTVSVRAADSNSLLWGNQKSNIKTESGLGEKDPREIIASVIRVILGFLGIIAVIIIIMGGFKWMTSGGNDTKAKEARDMIVAGVIGLIIILAAFGIASFVTDKLFDVTGAG